MNDFTKEDVKFLFQKFDEYLEMQKTEFLDVKQKEIENIKKIIYLIEGCCVVNEDIDLEYIVLLRRKKRDLSRQFGNVILLASEMVSSGQLDSALFQLDEFINSCNSPFYKKQAEDRKLFYQKERT